MKTNRTIPLEADRILDAPSVTDDFYLNLMDWGPNNQLAVALDNVIFIWNAETAEIKYVERIGHNFYVGNLSRI